MSNFGNADILKAFVAVLFIILPIKGDTEISAL